MNTKKYTITTAVTLAVASSLAIVGLLALPAFAQTSQNNQSGQNGNNGNNGHPPAWAPAYGERGGAGNMGMKNGHGIGYMGSTTMGMGMRQGVFGTVTATNGTTLTVSGKQGFGSTTASTIFTVDASNATVRKSNATSTVSSILVGDTIVVRGTVSGTNVTATTILDGIVMPTGMVGGQGHYGNFGTSTGMYGGMYGRQASSTRPSSMPSPITGNGQPVIAGKVSAINGSSLTITTASNVTYTVDVTNAKIVQGQTTVTVSNITVGDSVIIQGAVNGTSVTASSVIDQKVGQMMGQPSQPNQKPSAGLFGAIGSFFKHIFGF